MQLTEIYTLKLNAKQKNTLQVLHKKYRINASQFIRDAINEKLQRDKDGILAKYKEVEEYLNEFNIVPF